MSNHVRTSISPAYRRTGGIRRHALAAGLLASAGFHAAALALDEIPENIANWTDQGQIMDATEAWESSGFIRIAGAEVVDGTYYVFYLSGFDGCWNADDDSNHQSLGLITSTDGETWTKYVGNPVLTPQHFVPVSSHEEGIRTAFVRYVPSEGVFHGFFGVESPGGSQTCSHMQAQGGGCGCNISVDAASYHATSVDGVTWTNMSAVDGDFASGGVEAYAVGWVHNGVEFVNFFTRAEGGQDHGVSRGTDPTDLTQLSTNLGLDWGWSSLDAYLHDDMNTITIMADPRGSTGESPPATHPGISNNNLYFWTTTFADPTNVVNQRVVSTSFSPRENKILHVGDQWLWFHSDGDDEIRLMTHPFEGAGTPPPAPTNESLQFIQ